MDERIEQSTLRPPQRLVRTQINTLVEKSAYDEPPTVPVAIDPGGKNPVILGEGVIDAQYLAHEQMLVELLVKSSSQNIVPSFYEGGEIYIASKEKEDVTDTESLRRAIHTMSNYYNTLGIFRDDFDKSLNDKMARNAYYAIGEKAIMDYFGTLEWVVKDKKDGTPVEKAIDFISDPNPQDSFDDMKKMVVRDLIRYDAGVIVKSFNKGGYLNEMKSYLGTEFWREQDRVPLIINVPVMTAVNLKGGNFKGNLNQPSYQGWWSHGYTERFWQRSRTGVYIPFQPEEISYFMMYPRSDGIYGTDFIKYLKYQMQYLIDSTKAAGKTFENGIVPSIVWEHPEMRSIPQFRQRVKEAQFNNQGWNRFGSVIHTVNGEKVSSLAQSLHDMQWLEGQKFVAQLIWAMWGFSQDEFLGGGANRATAYVKRNITKSRMLYPLMDYFEQKINREILPYLKGYRKTWKFEFLKDVELDDEQKIAQINSVKSSTLNTYINMNFPVEIAIKLSGIGDDLSTDDVESIKDTINAQQMQMLQEQVSGTDGTDVMDGQGGQAAGMNPELEQGRYDGEGAGTENYQPINFSDYGLGGAGTETRVGEEDEKQYKKAKVYINHPGEAPKGRSVKRGNRGGYYYITADAPTGKAPGGGATRPAKKPGKPQGWGDRQSNEPTQSGGSSGGAGSGGGGPGQPVQVTIRGDDMGLVVSVQNGVLVGEGLPTQNTADFLKTVKEAIGDEVRPEKVIELMIELAQQNGLEVV